jgi:hypothetical protein
MLKTTTGLIDGTTYRYVQHMLRREAEPATAPEPKIRKRHSFQHPCHIDDLNISRGFVGLDIVPGDI